MSTKQAFSRVTREGLFLGPLPRELLRGRPESRCFSIAIGVEIGNLEKYPECSSELLALFLPELLESSDFQKPWE